MQRCAIRKMPGRRGGALLWIFGIVAISEAFRPPQRLQTSMMADNQDKKKAPRKEPGLGTKVAWYASEAFGDIASVFSEKKEKRIADEAVASIGPLDSTQAVERLRKEYDKKYFVTGDLDTSLYEDDCEFADPFVSFKGTARFQKNLENLGPFMEDVKLQLTQFDVVPPGKETDLGDGMVVKTRWRFRCVLGLPWRPSLAAGGGTIHVFSPESGRIVRHIESWDIDPWDGVKQVLTPGKKRRETGE